MGLNCNKLSEIRYYFATNVVSEMINNGKQKWSNYNIIFVFLDG